MGLWKEASATSLSRKRLVLRRSWERLEVMSTPRSGRKRGWCQDVQEEGDREGGIRTGD